MFARCRYLGRERPAGHAYTEGLLAVIDDIAARLDPGDPPSARCRVGVIDHLAVLCRGATLRKPRPHLGRRKVPGAGSSEPIAHNRCTRKSPNEILGAVSDWGAGVRSRHEAVAHEGRPGPQEMI
jgi:hypothetical protein